MLSCMSRAESTAPNRCSQYTERVRAFACVCALFVSISCNSSNDSPCFANYATVAIVAGGCTASIAIDCDNGQSEPCRASDTSTCPPSVPSAVQSFSEPVGTKCNIHVVCGDGTIEDTEVSFENISDGGMCVVAQVVDSGSLPAGTVALDACKHVNLSASKVPICVSDSGTD